MRRLTALGAVALLALGMAGCDVDRSTVARPGEPVVLTGADLASLRGWAPGRLVAFRHQYSGDRPEWSQIPVQVDERKVVAFGTPPATNGDPGVEGTVYGHGSGGPTALQYADPHTFVGADVNPTFDRNDELVFMADDAGGLPRDGDPAVPRGVRPGSGVRVELSEPDGSGAGWVHLFVSDGTLQPAGGRDYVDYDFSLVGGDYRSRYDRSYGPNPETSQVVTDNYRIGFSDRWFEDSWQITAGSATGVDILDGHKNQFALASCVRSNSTFANDEGAFVANIDGPVRAIRSYVGANSGPLTQRTHLLYRDREEIITDLRVHAIPGIIDFVDYSAAAVDMVYRSSSRPSGVTVDGRPDPVSSQTAAWEVVNGAQGAVYTRSTFTSSAPGLQTSWFYRDQVRPPEYQCWGDDSFYGASGPALSGGVPNTDPGLGPAATLRARRTVHFMAPFTDGGRLVAAARGLTADIEQPLRVRTSTDHR